jgi:hypothetical protein
MGAPSSALITEIFLQHAELTHLNPITGKCHITGYFRFVYNIFITYDSSQTNIQSILNNFNNIHTKLNFMSESEKNNNINYLDLSTSRPEFNFVFHIYQKPTFSDIIIHATQNNINMLQTGSYITVYIPTI